MLNTHAHKPNPGPDPENVSSHIVGAVYACLLTAQRGRLAMICEVRHHAIFGPVRVSVGLYLSPDETVSFGAIVHFHN